MNQTIHSTFQSPFSLLIMGGASSGKSSFVNALLGESIAAVSNGFDVQTTSFDCYQKENWSIWDSPAFEVGEQEKFNSFLAAHSIDHILWINEANSRDIGVMLHVFSDFLMPVFEKQISSKVTIGLSQADLARGGRSWDPVLNSPLPELSDFLSQKESSITERINESLSLHINTVSFSSGFSDEFDTQGSFNILAVANLISKNIKVCPVPMKVSIWCKVRSFFTNLLKQQPDKK